nr:uncharacterized protein LOC113827067 [Penaeus vannamei]
MVFSDSNPEKVISPLLTGAKENAQAMERHRAIKHPDVRRTRAPPMWSPWMAVMEASAKKEQLRSFSSDSSSSVGQYERSDCDFRGGLVASVAPPCLRTTAYMEPSRPSWRYPYVGYSVKTVACVTYNVAAAPLAYNVAPFAPVAPIQSQYHAQDEIGQYSFGYAGGPSSRAESRDAFGVVRGSYNYVDSEGKVQTQHYVADALGFRVSRTNLPVAPDAPVAAPLAALPGPLPEPVQDTPEVAAAKAAHQQAYDEAAAAAAAAPDTRKKRSVLAAPGLGVYSPLRFSYGFSAPLHYAHPTAYASPLHYTAAHPALTTYNAAHVPTTYAAAAPPPMYQEEGSGCERKGKPRPRRRYSALMVKTLTDVFKGRGQSVPQDSAWMMTISVVVLVGRGSVSRLAHDTVYGSYHGLLDVIYSRLFISASLLVRKTPVITFVALALVYKGQMKAFATGKRLKGITAIQTERQRRAYRATPSAPVLSRGSRRLPAVYKGLSRPYPADSSSSTVGQHERSGELISVAALVASGSAAVIPYNGVYGGYHGLLGAYPYAGYSGLHPYSYAGLKSLLPVTYNVAAAPLAYNVAPFAPVAPIQSQYHAQDEIGQYSFGYAGGPSSRAESRDAFGVVRGSYNYVDSEGKVQTQHYVADALGFRVSGTNLPVAPTPPSRPSGRPSRPHPRTRPGHPRGSRRQGCPSTGLRRSRRRRCCCPRHPVRILNWRKHSDMFYSTWCVEHSRPSSPTSETLLWTVC